MGKIDPTKQFSHIVKDYTYDNNIDSEVSFFTLMFTDGTHTRITHNAAIGMRKFAGVECREWDDNNRPFNSSRVLTVEQIAQCRAYAAEREEKESTPVEDVVRYLWN